MATLDHCENRIYAHRRDPKPEPKPCQRFAKRFVYNERFKKHLPGCRACKALLAYLYRESEIDMYVHEHRN